MIGPARTQARSPQDELADTLAGRLQMHRDAVDSDAPVPPAMPDPAALVADPNAPVAPPAPVAPGPPPALDANGMPVTPIPAGPMVPPEQVAAPPVPTESLQEAAAPYGPTEIQGPGPKRARKAGADKSLRAQSIADSGVDSLNKVQADRNSAMALESKGLADAAQNDIDAANAAQPFMERKAELERQKLLGQQAIDQYVNKMQMESLEETKQDVEAWKEQYRHNPRDIWGNSNLSQRFGAVIGMIGAGISTQGHSRFVEDLIEQSALAHQRKGEILGKIQGAHERLAEQRTALGEKASTQFKTTQLGLIGALNMELEAAKNKFQAPAIRARYEQAQGELLAKSADLEQGIVKERFNEKIGAAQQQLAWAQMNARREEQALAQRAQAQKADENKKIRYSDLSEGEGLLPGDRAKITEKHVANINMVRRLDDITNLFDTEGGFNLQSKETLDAFNALLSGDARKLLGSGAALNPAEQAALDSLKVGYKRYTAGELGGLELKDLVQQVQGAIVDADYQEISVLDKTAKYDPESTTGRVYARRQQDDARRIVGQAEVQKVVTSNKSDAEKRLELGLLARQGNKAAKMMLDSAPGVRDMGEVTELDGD